MTQDQCLFVGTRCANAQPGPLYYLLFYFCNSVPPAISFLMLVIWLLLLFSLVGIAASDFFCPNLSAIANSLNLSQNMAGVTFLALGNGSPDLFSVTHKTFGALTAGSGGLAIGELIGAALFITNVVVGSMAIISPFRVAPYPFLRDMVFLLGAVTFVVYTVQDNQLTLAEGLFLIFYYVLYVAVAMSGQWTQQSSVWLRQIRSIFAARRSIRAPESGDPSDLHEREPLLDAICDTAFTPIEAVRTLNGETVASDQCVAGPNSVSFGRYRDQTTIFSEDRRQNQHLISRVTALAVTQTSLLFRKKVQRQRRQSFFDVFEFRDIWRSLKSPITAPGSRCAASTRVHPIRQQSCTSHRANEPCSFAEQANLDNGTSSGSQIERSENVGPCQVASISCANPLNTATADKQKTKASIACMHQPCPLAQLHDKCPLQLDTTQLSSHPEPVTKGPTAHALQIQNFDSMGILHDHPNQNSKLVLLPASASVTPIAQTNYAPISPCNFVSASENNKPNTSAVRPLVELLFPHLVDWKFKSYAGKILAVVTLPFVFLLTITIPVIDTHLEVYSSSGENQLHSQCSNLCSYDAYQEAVPCLEYEELGPDDGFACKWNRWLTLIQCLAAPIFTAFVMIATVDLPVYLTTLAAVFGLGAAGFCWLVTTDGMLPWWYKFVSFVGFFVAMEWIYLIVNEVVKLLQTFGIILHLSEAIIGLTVFAMGNSLGDFVANVTIARMGFPIMAVTACFGGPLLSELPSYDEYFQEALLTFRCPQDILLGIGISTTYVTASTGQPFSLANMAPTIFMSSFVLIASLVSSLVILPMNAYHLNRRYGIFLIAFYCFGMVANLLIEVALVH